MKSHVKIAFLCILVLTSCTTSAVDNVKPSSTTLTNTAVVNEAVTPVPDTPAPTATPDLTFDITKDYQIIQQDNDAPACIPKTLPSQELAYNHTGLWFEEYGRYKDSEFVFSNGFKRLRLGSLYHVTAEDQD